MSTQSLEPKSNPPKRGIPLWFALTALLVLAVVSIVVLAFILRQAANDKTKLQRQLQAWELEKGKTEIDRQKAAEQAKLALARTRQTDALAQVRIGTNACGQLLQNLQELEKEAASLRTSDAGRLVARHPDLVALARRLYEVDLRELPQRDLVISKLEGVRRLESQLVSAAGSSFEPDASFTSTAQSDTLWANQEASRVQRARSLIETLVREGKIKIPAQDANGQITLETAIANLSQNDVVARQRVITEKTTVATTTAAASIASAEAEKILNDAKLQASRILEEANTQSAKQQQEQALRDAGRKVEESKVKVAVSEAADEARNVQLRAKAKDPKIQVKLAPFTTPGYFQIKNGVSYEKAPLSYSGLVQTGALAPTESGLQRLVDLAHNRQDQIRPRWRFHLAGPAAWKRDTGEREMVMEAQQLLVELGPTLVEMGLLQK